jgi:hypothetical protein
MAMHGDALMQLQLLEIKRPPHVDDPVLISLSHFSSRQLSLRREDLNAKDAKYDRKGRKKVIPSRSLRLSSLRPLRLNLKSPNTSF